MKSSPTVQRHVDRAAALQAIEQWLTQIAVWSIADHGLVSLALTGGHTPLPLYERMAAAQKAWPWADTVLFWGDERDVPPHSPDSNFGTCERTLLTQLATPPRAIHAWRTSGPPSAALADYRHALATLPQRDGIPVLDIVLLGVGADGHVASLFPASPQLDARDWVAYGPGPIAPRYTLTFPLLEHAHHIAVLVTGTDKAPIVRKILVERQALPASRLPADRTVWFLDRDAASLLNDEDHRDI
ncbi:MAG: 6-phosphogluconolactonase [Thermaerobacter sp.]|nr:6-phosphogluconolactonase [Thermaerobacter sp.]